MGRKRALAWLVGGVALMVGCAHRVRPGGQARTDLAYLYGRFFTKGPNSVAFVLRCQNDENKYVLKSIDRPDVQVLELAPKRCWLVEAVMESSGQHPPGLPVLKRGEVGKRIAIEPPIQRPLDFAGGHAYYLGDYIAAGETTSDHGSLVTHFHGQWFWSSLDDRYESTTAEMKRLFPSLASFPTADVRLILPPPRKADNGVGAAPGEPPMSPERIARVAPFIKRNYASPGECEAACPTGQCRPYRGENGPAVACVTRCNTDKDCPDGLACNCPDAAESAGDACHRIATTPQDPMARICLSVQATGERR
jgi:hypothetical protein